jgi:hypothetical protein
MVVHMATGSAWWLVALLALEPADVGECDAKTGKEEVVAVAHQILIGQAHDFSGGESPRLLALANQSYARVERGH